ncbi:MAG: FAD-binding oxidoreductase, partial [Acidimicrobiales bacterium]
WWGWGYEGEGLSDAEVGALGALLGERFGLDGTRRQPPVAEDLVMRAPRLQPPPALAAITSTAIAERAGHSYGKSYRDVVRALRGQLDHPPDVVARPRTESEVADLLDWCASAGAAAIPYGGGSSVVGGVEPDVGDGYAGALTIDLGAMDRVVEVDRVSQAARIQAGALGPALEDQLRPHGLTLRHFPQSFECSTLGGWIATRAGGHFATGPTHIDDLVESVRVVTPAGLVETRRLPGSGAGPSPDRLFLGSEGTLGIVTEAWVRVRARPRWRAGGPARFATFSAGAEAVRALAQSGLQPSNCRLIDPTEALVNGAGDGTAAVLIVGFESADHPLRHQADRAAELVGDHGGQVDGAAWRTTDSTERKTGEGSAAAWRASFMRAPYRRDALVSLGVLCETFETACTWDRFDKLHEAVSAAVRDALVEVGAGAGFVTCRFTHVYPDGLAPYFTVIAPARPGAELEQWATIKAAASDAVIDAGGTISHHHAVGRDHRCWYDRQRPELYARALAAAKAVLDPAGICNPGVLLDPPRRTGGGPGA